MIKPHTHRGVIIFVVIVVVVVVVVVVFVFVFVVPVLTADRTDCRLSSIIRPTKPSIVVVAVHRHLLAKTRVIRSVIDKFRVTSGGRNTGAIGLNMNTAR